MGRAVGVTRGGGPSLRGAVRGAHGSSISADGGASPISRGENAAPGVELFQEMTSRSFGALLIVVLLTTGCALRDQSDTRREQDSSLPRVVRIKEGKVIFWLKPDAVEAAKGLGRKFRRCGWRFSGPRRQDTPQSRDRCVPRCQPRVDDRGHRGGRKNASKHPDTGRTHTEWFFGTRNLPLWAGYTIGYQIARRFVRAKAISAGAAATTPAAGILRGNRHD
jgi:hypothetical protein